ncbi:MAG TPA: SDR family oxidoreductase [bacterium]|nr:SDR family oxidoreductase [bacterium]
MDRRPAVDRLRDQVAIVAGASHGLGPHIVAALAHEGAAVIAQYARQGAAAEAVVAAVQASGGRAQAMQADLAQPSEAAAVVAAATAAFGRLDILVTISLPADQSVLALHDDAWTAVVGTNLSGTFYCMRAALREFVRQRRGRIIAITTPVPASGSPGGSAAYVTGTAGLVGLTRAMAREVGSRGITVNAVAPGAVPLNGGGRSAAIDPSIEYIPLARAGSVDEIAAAVLFLASDEAAYITGQVLHVDGGMIMH